MNGKEHREIIEQMARDRLVEVRSDIWEAYYRAIRDVYILGLNVSVGALRLKSPVPTRTPKPVPPSIDDPTVSPETANPS